MGLVRIPIAIGELVPGATAQPTPINVAGTNNPVIGYAFRDTTSDDLIYTEPQFLANYGASNPNIDVLIDWYGSPTSGAAVLGAALQARTPGDAQSVLTDAFATEATTTTTINGTANGPNRTTVTITALDSAAPNDNVIVRIARRQSNGSDTLAGFVNITGVTLQYSDT